MKNCLHFAHFVALVCLAGLLLVFGILETQGQTSCAGRVDASFRPSPSELGVPLYVGRSAYVAAQPDGRVLFGGSIDVSGEGVGLVRLKPDGTIDTSFDGSSLHELALLTALALQSDGRVLVGGSGLVRLLANGDPDAGFSVELSGDDRWWYRAPTRLALQSDGKLVVTGGFAQVNGLERSGLARLLPDGSVDMAFVVATNDLPASIDAVLVQPDGKILITGYSLDTTILQGQLVRLLPSGRRDTNFHFSPTLDRGISAITLQPDGKILASGYYWESYYRSYGFIARLNGDGSPDSTFGGTAGEVGVNGYDGEGVSTMVVQADAKIVVGGSFFDTEGSDINFGSLARLNPDGSRDLGFQPGFLLSRWADDIESVTSIALQTDGGILMAGDFSMVGGVPRPGVARLFSGSNDCQGVITFSAGSYAGREGASDPSVTIRRDGGNLGPITVQYTVQALRDDTGGFFLSGIMGGTPAEDLSQVTGQVSFAAGETSKAFAVEIRSDGLIEPTESFEIVLSGSTGQAAYGDLSRALLHVFDADSLGLPGALDFSFTEQVSGTVSALFTQADGKLLVGGSFTSIGSVNRNNLLRLNADGTLDVHFNPPPELSSVAAIALQLDGKIVIGGDTVARLESNGSVDASFQAFAPGIAVATLAAQNDGKILVGSSGGLLRLKTDGVPDTSFVAFDGMAPTNHVSDVRAVAFQPDGKIIAGGQNAITHLPVVVRLNSDGTRDMAFNGAGFQMGYHGGFDLGVLSLLLQPDGKIVVGGGFSYVATNGTGWNLIRLKSDGTLDTGFYANPAVNTYIKAIARQPDGKLLVSGYLWGYNFGDAVGLSRLFEDGTSDHSFFTGMGALAGIDAIALNSSGSIWIGGTFSKYNGYPQAALARLHGDDQSGPGRIEFVQSYGPVKENAGLAALKIRRYWGTDGIVSAQYATSNGTAIAGLHYVGQAGTVVFASGEIEKTITVPLIDDTTPEFDRYFTLTLDHTTGGAALGQFSNTWVNIIENDRGILARRTELLGNYLFIRDDFNVRESAGALRIELFYVGDPTDGPISLDFATSDGSARAGLDYSARSGSTQFGGPYSRQQDFSVPILGDMITEGSETFAITLRTAAPGVTLVTSNLVVTIIEGDPLLRLQPHPSGPTASGRFRMLLDASPSISFSLEASIDLVSWTVLANFPPRASEDPIEFEDADAANFSQRFYRLVTPH
jgi:uncharacterized delta-60 repeat protein